MLRRRCNPCKFMMLLGVLSWLATSACNSGSKSLPVSSSSSMITGAGSTFINPAMMLWVDSFQTAHPGTRINYQSIGSGGGIQQLKQGLVDFGASDVPLDDQQLREMPPLLQIPESAGAVCITYNLPEVKTALRLSPSTLSGIYLGKIKDWQDPAVSQDNPGVRLPSTPILVAHRTESSGTTNIFTTYLAKITPEWEKTVGKGLSVRWPIGFGGKGSEGVTGIVKQTPGGIGYVEQSYAKQNNLPVAAIQNRAGKWVEPTAEATTAAIEAFSAELARDVRTSIVDPPASAKDAYPIAGLTFLLVPKEGRDPAKTQKLREFVEYVITQGQYEAAKLGYAKLPPQVQQQGQAMLAQIGTKQAAGGDH